MTGDRYPVSRPRVFAATVLIVVLLGILVAGVELLRHPLPGGFDDDIGLSGEGGDPRVAVECGEALPREGQTREGQEREAPPDARVEPGVGAPIEVTSNELYDCPEIYDGLPVRYRGEAIGAVLERNDGAWVQLNDDIYAEVLGPLPAHRDYRGGNAGVGVFIPRDLADRIEWVGGPDTQGDVLEIRGTFQRVDPESAEVAIIRADDAEIVRRGGYFDQEPLHDRRNLAIVAALVAVLVTVAERIAARRR